MNCVNLFVNKATRIRLKSSGNTVALEVDARNSGRWRRCATIAHVDMPKDWATKCTIGMLARTGELVRLGMLLNLRHFSGQDVFFVVIYIYILFTPPDK